MRSRENAAEAAEPGEESRMTLRIDRRRCAGSGLCAVQLPDVFDQSEEDGKVLLTTPEPGPRLAGAVRAAAARCPSGAITLHGGGPAGERPRDGNGTGRPRGRAQDTEEAW
ncbi:ferredoxin [Streptomyces xinghaiensis]|uniref:ferredoxin n=1 Tax=Streptomyces xinghaiensis TaxID=1038928 RepID=UPI00378EC86D